MQWSQLRKQLSERLAPSLAKRVDFHVARYRTAHDELGRAWVTFDGDEVVSLSDQEFENEYYPLASEIRRINQAEDYSTQTTEYRAAYDSAREITAAKGNFARWDFTTAARRFLTLPIEDALTAEDPLIRALAVLDRRVGKSRLRKMAASKAENPVIRRLLKVRCDAENVPL